MRDIPDMHEDEVRELLATLRHFNAFENIGEAGNMIEKSADAIAVLLMNRRDMMMRIAYLDGLVEGMGYLPNPFAEVLGGYFDDEDEMDDEDEDDAEMTQ